MKAFLQTFFRQIVGSIFIAICALLGFGPTEWAKMILGIDQIWLARGIFIALAVATAASLWGRSLWTNVRGGGAASDPARISLHTFMHVEALKYGWTREAGPSDLGELLDAIRQAAVDGSIHFWGRKPAYFVSERPFDTPLVRMNGDYWHENKIEPTRAVFLDDNAGIYSSYEADDDHDKRNRFYDLHLDRKEALDWLKRSPSKPS